MKYFACIALTAALMPLQALAAPFQPFAALSNGKDCRIILDFPDGEFCGDKVPVEAVRSWYFGQGSTVGNSSDILAGQRYDFGVVVNADNGTKVIPVRFLNPGTAKRFYIQMGAWSGKVSADGGLSPFPNWLDVAK